MNRFLVVAGLAVAVFVANAWSQTVAGKGFSPKAGKAAAQMKMGR